MDDAHHEQTLLAWDLNGRGPLRVRVERLLGYMQPKYVQRIELVDSPSALGRGHGGYWEVLGYRAGTGASRSRSETDVTCRMQVDPSAAVTRRFVLLGTAMQHGSRLP